MVEKGLESGKSEYTARRLTLGKRIYRLTVLHLVTELRRIRANPRCRIVERHGQPIPLAYGKEYSSGRLRFPGQTRLRLRALASQRRTSPVMRIPRDLRAMETRKKERRWAISSRGTREIGVASPALLSPRRLDLSKTCRREKNERWRVGHGVARAIEDLRGVRLSLVPRSESGKRVLQNLRDEAQGFSFAGEPKTTRPSMP